MKISGAIIFFNWKYEYLGNIVSQKLKIIIAYIIYKINNFLKNKIEQDTEETD